MPNRLKFTVTCESPDSKVWQTWVGTTLYRPDTYLEDVQSHLINEAGDLYPWVAAKMRGEPTLVDDDHIDFFREVPEEALSWFPKTEGQRVVFTLEFEAVEKIWRAEVASRLSHCDDAAVKDFLVIEVAELCPYVASKMRGDPTPLTVYLQSELEPLPVEVPNDAELFEEVTEPYDFGYDHTGLN